MKKKIINLGSVIFWITMNTIGIGSIIYTTMNFEFMYAFNLISGVCLFLVMLPAVYLFDALLNLRDNREWDISLELGASIIVLFLIAFSYAILSILEISTITECIFLDVIILTSAFSLIVSIIIIAIFVLHSYITRL
ncbi:MAG: hypothetical protein ACFFAS_13555 [Promethearchaeota archaeon]